MQALADAAEVAQIVKEIAPSRSVNEEYVRHVCRNSLFLRVLRIRSLAQEYDSATAHSEQLGAFAPPPSRALLLLRPRLMMIVLPSAEALSDPESNLPWYLVLRAVDRFYAAHGRVPGWTNEQVLADIPLLKVQRPSPPRRTIPSSYSDVGYHRHRRRHHHQEQVEGLLKELSLDASVVSEAIVHETCRFGGSELHNVAAFMGGVVSQEAIKVITCQWLPANNAFVYNGINSTTTSFEL